jgi:hypothetical protein
LQLTTTLASQIYQITTHKIQVFNESNQSVKPRLIPQLPGGKTNDDEHAKMNKDSDDLLAAFSDVLGWASSPEPAKPSLFKPKPSRALTRACSGLRLGFRF